MNFKLDFKKYETNFRRNKILEHAPKMQKKNATIKLTQLQAEQQ